MDLEKSIEKYLNKKKEIAGGVEGGQGDGDVEAVT